MKEVQESELLNYTGFLFTQHSEDVRVGKRIFLLIPATQSEQLPEFHKKSCS
jgi:hypothetical protein